MKKLMTMLVALACASGAWAAFSDSGENFDEKSAGAFDTSTDAKWKWTAGSDESLTVKAWAETDTKPSSFPKNGDADITKDKNYLTVETTFQNPAYRAVTDFTGDNPTEVSFDDQVYFDSLVQLTAGDQSSLSNATEETSFPGDARIAVYLAEVETEDADPEKHIFVKAGNIDSTGGNNPTFYDCGTGVTEGWHRLTVRCFKDVTRTGKKIPGYVVYIDGTALKVVEGTAARFDKTDDVAVFVPKCAALNTAGSLFPSLSATATGIKAVGFAGNGSVDDLIFTADKPSFVEDDQNYFHLTWEEGVASVSYAIGEGEKTSASNEDIQNGYVDILLNAGADTKISVEATYATNYKAGTWTCDDGIVLAQDGNSGTFTIKAGDLTPAGAIVAANDSKVATVKVKISNVEYELDKITALADIASAIAAKVSEVGDGATLSDVVITLESDTTVSVTDAEGTGMVCLGGADQNWTLNLNGYAITDVSVGVGDEGNLGWSVIEIDGGAVTIKDAPADTSKSGKIVLGNLTSGMIYVDDGKLTIESGIFDGDVVLGSDDGKSPTLSITGGSFLASANQTEGDSPTFSLASYVDTAKATASTTTSKIGDVDYWVVTTNGGDTPTEDYAAKIGDTGYETIQGAIDQAVKDATLDTPVTIDICKSVTLTAPLTLTGTGIEKTETVNGTAIVINTPENVTVTINPETATDAAFTISQAAVAFTGAGKWTTSSTKALLYTADGAIAVKDGTYETTAETAYNILAWVTTTTENETVKLASNGAFFVFGGAFIASTSLTDSPVSFGGDAEKLSDEDLVTLADKGCISTTGGVTMKGSADSAKDMSDYLATYDSEKQEWTTDVDGYKFADGDNDGVYTITTFAPVTLSITLDAGVEKVVLKASDDEETETITADSYSTTYDPADAVKVTLTVTVKDGYELALDEGVSFENIEMTANQTIAIKTTALPTVAKIGDAEYKTLQSAIDAAITNGGEQTIEIVADIDLSSGATLVLKGNGIESTKITFNLPEGKTVIVGEGDGCGATEGWNIDNATVTFTGAGTWKKVGNAKFFKIGEKSAAANVTVEGGTFLHLWKEGADSGPSGLMRIRRGTLTVNGGAFTSAGYYVFAAGSISETEYGQVVINGGSVAMTWDNASAVPTSSEDYGKLEIPVNSTAKFQGYAANITDKTAGYLVDAVMGGETLKASDYTLALDSDGWYVVTKKAPTAYEPGTTEETSYETEALAEAEATKINDAIKAGTATFTVPKNLTDTDLVAAYRKLFAAKVVTVTGDSTTTYQVKFDFTDDATTGLQAQVDADVKLVELAKIAAAADTTTEISTEVTTTPGLYYTVYSGSETPATLTKDGDSVFATGAKTALKFKKQGTRGFYKIGVSIKPIE